MIKNTYILTAFLVFSLVLALPGVAAVNEDSVGVSCQFLDNSGDPIVGANVVVSIYDASTGGSQLYSETFNSATDSNGVCTFNTLASSSTLPLEEGQEYFLDITVNGNDYDFNGIERQAFIAWFGQSKTLSGNVTASGFSGDGSQLTGLTLNQLTDTTVSSPADQEFLRYNSGSGQWENSAYSASGAYDAAGADVYNVQTLTHDAEVSNTGTTIDWSTGNLQNIALSNENSTLTFQNPRGPSQLALRFVLAGASSSLNWQNQQSPFIPDEGAAMEVDTNGDVYVIENGDLVKYNSAGTQQWSKNINVKGLALSSSAVYAAGASNQIYRYDKNGNLVWQQDITGEPGWSTNQILDIDHYLLQNTDRLAVVNIVGEIGIMEDVGGPPILQAVDSTAPNGLSEVQVQSNQFGSTTTAWASFQNELYEYSVGTSSISNTNSIAEGVTIQEIYWDGNALFGALDSTGIREYAPGLTTTQTISTTQRAYSVHVVSSGEIYAATDQNSPGTAKIEKYSAGGSLLQAYDISSTLQGNYPVALRVDSSDNMVVYEGGDIEQSALGSDLGTYSFAQIPGLSAANDIDYATSSNVTIQGDDVNWSTLNSSDKSVVVNYYYNGNGEYVAQAATTSATSSGGTTSAAGTSTELQYRNSSDGSFAASSFTYNDSWDGYLPAIELSADHRIGLDEFGNSLGILSGYYATSIWQSPEYLTLGRASTDNWIRMSNQSGTEVMEFIKADGIYRFSDFQTGSGSPTFDSTLDFSSSNGKYTIPATNGTLATEAYVLANAGGGSSFDPNGTGTDSLAIGNSATASGDGAAAYGNASTAAGLYGVAIGDSANASATDTVSIGRDSSVTTQQGISLGSEASSTAQAGIALGFQSSAALASVALGYQTDASGSFGIAQGFQAIANNTASIAIGNSAIASGGGGAAYGSNSQATGINAVAIGAGASSADGESVAIGDAASAGASAGGGVAIGPDSSVTGDFGSIALGDTSTTSGTSSIALGFQSIASGATSTAIGRSANASAENAHAFGKFTEASALNALALGTVAESHGNYSSALGAAVVNNGQNSFVVGDQFTSSVDNAFVYGSQFVEYLRVNDTGVYHKGVELGGGGSIDTSANYTWTGTHDYTSASVSGLVTGTGDAGAKVQLGTGASAGESTDSVAIGPNAFTGGFVSTDAVALGSAAAANDFASTAIGANTDASSSAVAVGEGAQATNTGAVAVGRGSASSQARSISIGDSATASAANAVTIGYNIANSQADSMIYGVQGTVHFRSNSTGVYINNDADKLATEAYVQANAGSLDTSANYNWTGLNRFTNNNNEFTGTSYSFNTGSAALDTNSQCVTVTSPDGSNTAEVCNGGFGVRKGYVWANSATISLSAQTGNIDSYSAGDADVLAGTADNVTSMVLFLEGQYTSIGGSSINIGPNDDIIVEIQDDRGGSGAIQVVLDASVTSDAYSTTGILWIDNSDYRQVDIATTTPS